MSTITEKLKWLVEADATSAIKGFEKAGDAAEKNLSKAEEHSKKLGGTLTKVGAGAVAAGGIIGGALVKAAGAFEDLALESGKMADATGLSVDEASRWIEVAGDMGIGADVIQSSLGKMNKTLGATPAAFEDLGIQISRTASGAEDVNGTFLKTIARLQEFQDPAERAAAAAKIFGKGWQGAAELLNLSTTDIKTQLASVSDQKVINDDELSKAKEYRASLDHLKDSAEDLALSIGGSAAPVIGAVADALGSAVGGFTRLDTATGGAIGKFAAIATIGLGVVGTLSLVAGQAIKMRDRFTTLGDDGVRSLTNMGKAAQGVTVAVGVLGVALTGLEIANTLTQDTQGATDAMNEFINDSGHIVDVKTHTKELLENWQKLSEKVDDSKGIFDRTLGDLPHAFDQSGENLAHLQQGFDKLLATSPQLAEETVAALEATKAAADAGDTAAQHWLDKNSLSAKVIADLRAKVDDAAGATDVLTGKLDDNTAAGAESEAVVRSSTNAVDGYSYAAKSAAETVAGLQAHNKLMTDNLKRGLDADKAAMDNLLGVVNDDESWLNLQNNFAATAALFDDKGNVIVEKGKDAAQAMRDAGLAVDGLKKDVIAYGTEVLGLPTERITNIVAAVNPQSMDDVEALFANLTRNRNVDVQITTRGGAGYGVGAHAAGGRIPMGEALSVVGEKGPELISAPGSTVSNASDTAAMLGGGGDTFHIASLNVMLPLGTNFDKAVLQSMARLVRRNGPGVIPGNR